MQHSYTYYIAAAYGAGTYNTSTYQATGSTTQTTGTTTGTTQTTGGQLTNTGFDILVAATIACVIVFTALVIRFRKRRHSPTPPTTNS